MTYEEIAAEIAELKARLAKMKPRYDGDRHNPPSTFAAFTDMHINDDRGGRYGKGAIDKTQVNGRAPTVSYPASALSDQPDVGIEPPFDFDISYVAPVTEPHEIERAAEIAASRLSPVPAAPHSNVPREQPPQAGTTSSVPASFSSSAAVHPGSDSTNSQNQKVKRTWTS
jgi:hypothetical protein